MAVDDRGLPPGGSAAEGRGGLIDDTQGDRRRPELELRHKPSHKSAVTV